MCYKTTEAEKGLTVQTDNTWHDSTGLLLHTDFPGKTGIRSSFGYNGWGALVRDEGRNISSVDHDNLGNPVGVKFSTSDGREAKYVYSAKGERLRAEHRVNVTVQVDPVPKAPQLSDGSSIGDPQPLNPNIVVTTRLEYHGPAVYRNGKVDRVLFSGGYATIDGGGVTFHYYTRDYQGSNRAVVNGTTGAVEQTVAYYPYGGVIADLGTGAGIQPCKFGGKELTLYNGLDEYDFGARQYYPAVPHFTRIDPLCEQDYWLSPYLYCANDPVNNIDPTGCIIEGRTKKDASMAVEDFREIFSSEEFVNFRNLIVQSGKKQNGKSLARISPDALSTAFSGITLNEDQQALVDMVVNTINSDDIHTVEYLTPGKDMSQSSLNIFAEKLNSLGITQEMAESVQGGYSKFVMALCGEASTSITKSGSLSIILNSPNAFVTNRPATLGHEIIGHGRSFRLGYNNPESQHVLPIQVENLILRVMGVPLFRNGMDHAPLNKFIPNYMSLPIFR